jgi:hypothetical protein
VPVDDETRSRSANQATKLLAPLSAGDRLPWKIDLDGEPQWLVVIESLSPTSYLVQYPDERSEVLVDFE